MTVPRYQAPSSSQYISTVCPTIEWLPCSLILVEIGFLNAGCVFVRGILIKDTVKSVLVFRRSAIVWVNSSSDPLNRLWLRWVMVSPSWIEIEWANSLVRIPWWDGRTSSTHTEYCIESTTTSRSLTINPNLCRESYVYWKCCGNGNETVGFLDFLVFLVFLE